MKHEIKVPAMGESITEATVGTIMKPTGSLVKMDEEILELETDKVNQVLYAPQAGRVTLLVKTDQVVKIGEVIGSIEEAKGEEAPPSSPSKEKVIESPVKEKPGKKKQEKGPPPKEKVIEVPVKEEPVKKKQEKGHQIRKSKEEFVKEIQKPVEAPIEPLFNSRSKAARPEGERRETRKRLSKIRRVIAERLVEVQQTTAMLTTFNEVDMSQVIAIRTKHKEYFAKEYGAKLGFMSFFVKASVSALQAFPEVNSYIDGEEMVQRDYYDIGIAVGTERGLVVPVLRNCDHLNFAEIEQEIEQFAVKARQGTIAVGDLQGGGFTITNGGVYGSLLSTPILNPPQSGILGMHKIEKRPIVVEEEIVIRPMMYLALSYDHRVIDGKEAVSFLVHVKECLEDPARLLLGV